MKSIYGTDAKETFCTEYNMVARFLELLTLLNQLERKTGRK
jgi:hypothetical protein